MGSHGRYPFAPPLARAAVVAAQRLGAKLHQKALTGNAGTAAPAARRYHRL